MTKYIFRVFILLPILGFSEILLANDSLHLHGKLRSGLTYYLRKADNAGKTIHLRAVVRAGVENQDKDQLQVAHLIEHMGFRSTKHFPDSPMEVFAKQGIGLNGSTGSDYTIYEFTIPSGNPELLHNSLMLLRDWIDGIQLSDRNIDLEKGSVVAEITNGMNDNGLLEDKIRFKTLSHPWYVEGATLNEINSLNNIKHDAVKKFYNDWYRPDLQAIVILGDIDVKAIETDVKVLFNDLMAINRAMPKSFKDSLKYNLKGKNQELYIIHQKAQQPVLLINKKTEGLFRFLSHDNSKEAVIKRVYVNMVQRRFAILKRQYNLPFTDAMYLISDRGIWSTTQLDINNVEIIFNSKNIKDIERACRMVAIELAGIRKSGFSDAELKRGVADIQNDYTADVFNSPLNIVNKYIDCFRYNMPVAAIDEYEVFINELKQIKLSEINSIARELLDFKSNTDFVLISDNIEKVNIKGISKLFLRSNSTKTGNDVDDGSHSDLFNDFSIDPPKNPIVSIKRYDSIGVSEIKLANGAKIVLKPIKGIDNSVKPVMIRATRSLSIDNNEEGYINTLMAMQVVENSGVGNLNKFQLNDYKKRNDISLGLELNETGDVIDGKAPADKLEKLVQLIYLYCMKPRYDSLAYMDWLENSRRDITKSTRNLQYDFQSLYEDPLRRSITLNDLSKTKYTALYELYRKHYASMDGFKFYVFGDFDTSQVTALLSKYISAIPRGSFPSFYGRPQLKLIGRNAHVRYSPDATIANVTIRIPIKVDYNNQQKYILDVLTRELNSRIYSRLRVKEGGTYIQSAGGRFKGDIGEYEFVIIFQSDASKVEYLSRLAVDEFNSLKDSSISKEELLDIKDNIAKDNMETERDYYFWFHYLENRFKAGKHPTDITGELKTVGESIGLENINRFAVSALTTENIAFFVLLPVPRRD